MQLGGAGGDTSDSAWLLGLGPSVSLLEALLRERMRQRMYGAGDVPRRGGRRGTAPAAKESGRVPGEGSTTPAAVPTCGAAGVAFRLDEDGAGTGQSRGNLVPARSSDHSQADAEHCEDTEWCPHRRLVSARSNHLGVSRSSKRSWRARTDPRHASCDERRSPTNHSEATERPASARARRFGPSCCPHTTTSERPPAPAAEPSPRQAARSQRSSRHSVGTRRNRRPWLCRRQHRRRAA